MKATVYFAAPKLPTGRFTAEICPRGDEHFDGTVVSAEMAKEKFITVNEAGELFRASGLPIHIRTVRSLAYSNEIASVRPTPHRMMIGENSLRAYLSRLKADPAYWENRKDLSTSPKHSPANQPG
jgi:hypothetical protein